MGSKRKEKNKWIVNRSLWIDKLGIWICDKLLVLLVYPVLILTFNKHQPHRLKDWKPKRGKCKQIIKSVPPCSLTLNRQMELLTTWWTNSVCLWSEILFLLMWGSVDILCPIEEKNCLFYLSWPSMANYFELNFDFLFVWRCPPVCTKLMIFFFINGLRGNRYLHLEQYLYLRS